jgi:hypothetical protein
LAGQNAWTIAGRDPDALPRRDQPMPLIYRHNAASQWQPPKVEPEPDPIYADGIDWKPRNLFPNFSAKILPIVEYPGQDRHSPVQPHGDIQMAKATKKPAAKPKGSTSANKPKGPGVIETIIATISRERGASADEVLEILKGKFPDRDPDGMRRTIGIQAPKNCTSKQNDEKRGRVFYKRR